MEKFKLLKPVEFDGHTYTEIDLDLDNLNGNDMMMVERQFVTISNSNHIVTVKEFSKEYQILTAARAAKLPFEFFQQISAKDFSRITIRVQNFFVYGDSADE